MCKNSDDEGFDLQSNSLIDPKNTNARFVFLTLACFICVGSYFAYNNPAALESPIISVINIQALDLDLVSFNMLYSVYSLPNIFLPLFGGILTDNFGVRSVLMFFSVLVTIGQFLFYLGVSIKSVSLSLLGRGIFGCGGEVLELAQTIIMIKWFTGKELSMTFGVTSMFSLLGSVANDNIEPVICENYGLGVALLVSLFLCIGSLLVTILVINIDKSREVQTHVPTASGFRLRNLSSLDRIFFLLMANAVCMGCSIYSFSYIASGFLQDRFGFSTVEAGSIMSVSFFVSAFLSPIVGVLADKYGKRAGMMILANGLVLFFQGFWMWFGDNVGIGFIIVAFVELGIAFSIYVTVFWSSLACVVSEQVSGTAFGLVYSVENLALVVVPIVVGFIQENTQRDKGYFWVNGFLATLSVFGLACASLVYFIDIQGKGVLNRAVSKDLRSMERLD